MYFIACLFYILKMEWRKITWDCAPLSPVLRHPRAATSHSNRQSAGRVARGTATWRRSHRKSHHLSWGCDKRWQEMTIWVEKAFTYFVWGKMLVCAENWLWYTMIILSMLAVWARQKEYWPTCSGMYSSNQCLETSILSLVFWKKLSHLIAAKFFLELPSCNTTQKESGISWDHGIVPCKDIWRCHTIEWRPHDTFSWKWNLIRSSGVASSAVLPADKGWSHSDSLSQCHDFDGCMYGLTTQVGEEHVPLKKPWTYLWESAHKAEWGQSTTKERATYASPASPQWPLTFLILSIQNHLDHPLRLASG